jgi:hypothetical protein
MDEMMWEFILQEEARINHFYEMIIIRGRQDDM